MTTPWQPPDPIGQVPADVPRERARFRADLEWALSVCRTHPLLPVLSLLIGLAPLVSSFGSHRSVHDGVVTTAPASPGHQALSGVVSLAVLALVGWPGTQRLWFLRAATGRTMGAGEWFGLTFRYFGRFAVLGLTLVAVGSPLFIAGGIWYAEHTHRLADGTVTAPAPGGWFLVIGAVITVLLDVAFTFVTPAIVFTSHRIRDAVPVGFRLLVRSWPAAAPYALLPPLAAVAVSLYSGLRPAVSIPLVAASTLLNLVVKGATAAYYLRVMPSVGVDGALVLRQPQQWPYAPTGT
jgi:hypothetical protein